MKIHGLLLPVVVLIGLVVAVAPRRRRPVAAAAPAGFAQGIDVPTAARDSSQAAGSHLGFLAATAATRARAGRP